MHNLLKILFLRVSPQGLVVHEDAGKERERERERIESSWLSSTQLKLGTCACACVCVCVRSGHCVQPASQPASLIRGGRGGGAGGRGGGGGGAEI